MKIPFALVALIFLSLNSAAQSADSFKHIDLDEFIYQAGKPKSKKFKARIDHVTIVFDAWDSTNQRTKDTTAYLTHFPAIEAKEISIYEVGCRLPKYDTSQVSIFLVFLQIDGGDTVVRKVCLDYDEIRNRRTSHRFAPDESITVKPSDFYLGYAYYRKTKQATRVRAYCSARREREGAIAYFSKEKFVFYHVDFIAFIFPFTLKYY